jgi:ergothioneine biosynthesis protein EgtB
MADASPAKWHLAHTSWFFETFVLERFGGKFSAFHPDFRVLFNSYYNAVGDQHPRPERGLLTRPPLDEVIAYRTHVDSGIQTLLDSRSLSRATASAIELGIEHERQHQELILTDLKHLLSKSPLHPAYHAAPPEPLISDKPLQWLGFAEELCWTGHDGVGFCFDNERPQHRVFLDAFEIATRPATNDEYLAFMSDGGYERPELWLSDGWAALTEERWMGPLYWRREEDRWSTLTLAGLQPLRLDEPVCHVSYYEADAFARWMCARLPSEAEWERAASDHPIEGNFAESGRLHPAPTPVAASSEAAGVSEGLAQLYGDVWEWTQSDYAPYPGFRPLADGFGEYNGKFMCNQIVLRGGSCATPQSHIRPTYRNFFPPLARWQFSGIRLARDAS